MKSNAVRGRVLVIDDDASWRAAIRRLLRTEYDVSLAVDGLDALQKLANDGPFEAILCDIDMPSLDGIALHAQMTRLLPEQAGRVVFVTGSPISRKTVAHLDGLSNPLIDKSLALDTVCGVIQLLCAELAQPFPQHVLPATSDDGCRHRLELLKHHAEAARTAIDEFRAALQSECASPDLGPYVENLWPSALALHDLSSNSCGDVSSVLTAFNAGDAPAKFRSGMFSRRETEK